MQTYGSSTRSLRLINALIASHKESLEHIQKPNLVSFVEALKHLHYLCPKGSDIIVISDFYHLYNQDKQRLTQLRHHNRMQFVQIYDPLEQGQTQYRGREYVTDNKRSAWLDFSSKRRVKQLNRVIINIKSLLNIWQNRWLFHCINYRQQKHLHTN